MAPVRGGSSNAVTLTFPGPCSGAPLPPTNFLAYKSGTTIFVVWDPPTGGPAATGYVLNVSGSLSGNFPTTGRALSGTVGAGTLQPQRLCEQRVRRWQRDEPTGRDDSVTRCSRQAEGQVAGGFGARSSACRPPRHSAHQAHRAQLATDCHAAAAYSSRGEAGASSARRWLSAKRSPSAFTLNVVAKMKRPGKNASHGSVLSVVCAW